MAEVAAKSGVLVIQDVGGEERPMSDRFLSHCGYLFPNETELARLTGLPTESENEIIRAAKSLQVKGCKNVCCTLGAKGSILIAEDGQVLKQGAFPIPGGKLVDTTGAGDTFRAAFAVAMLEGKTQQEAMRFASAAGAITVSRHGAIPSLPTRNEVETLLCESDSTPKVTTCVTHTMIVSNGAATKAFTSTTIR